MPDLVDLLDRTTPDDLAPLDLPGLARRARGRTRRRRTALATSAALIVMVGAVAVRSTLAEDHRPNVAIGPAGPNGEPLVEPVGSWHHAAAPPFTPRYSSFGGALNDGRVLIWGGHRDRGDNPADDGSGDLFLAGESDGGIYDPVTDTWDVIPPAPVPPIATGGASITRAQLVDDRLAIVTGAEDGTIHAAVYDVDEGTWVDAPEQEHMIGLDAVVWDGETLALVRVRHDSPGDAEHDAPLTLRWRAGHAEWSVGQPFPLPIRNLPGTAVDGSRLAIWGGTSDQFIGDGNDATHVAFGDGATYDVASDTWARMADSPLTARSHAMLAWDDGRLFVGGGSRELGDHWGDLAAYDPSTGSWEVLEPAPIGGPNTFGPPWPGSFEDSAGPLLFADPMQGTGEPEPTWFYESGRWELAPLPGLGRIGEFLIATTHGWYSGSSHPFALQVRAGVDEWLDAAPAPLGDITPGTVVTTADTLVIVGGVDDGEPTDAAWVFDLAG